MKNIIKVMLQEGIDEETIHEVLNILEDREEEMLKARKEKVEDHDTKIGDIVSKKKLAGQAKAELKRASALSNLRSLRRGTYTQDPEGTITFPKTGHSFRTYNRNDNPEKIVGSAHKYYKDALSFYQGKAGYKKNKLKGDTQGQLRSIKHAEPSELSQTPIRKHKIETAKKRLENPQG